MTKGLHCIPSRCLASELRRRGHVALAVAVLSIVFASQAEAFALTNPRLTLHPKNGLTHPKMRSELSSNRCQVSMVAEKIKDAGKILKVVLSVGGAIWLPKQVFAAPPPMQNVYPASYYMQQADEEDDYVPMHPVAKFVTDKRVLTTVGVGVGVAGTVVAVRKLRKKSTEDYRKRLSALDGGLNIDASILDEARINRPGSKTVEFSNPQQFGTYRPPPEKKMRGIKDKYVFKDKKKPTLDDDVASKLKVTIFDNDDKPPPKSASVVDGAVEVEIVGEDDGPKTAEEKAKAEAMKGIGVDEKAMADLLGDVDYDALMNQAMMDPAAIDPSVMAGVLPKLQEQMAQVLKAGVDANDIAEVRQSFKEMGIDLEELFTSIEDLEKAGLAGETLGPEGVEFFRTLKEILKK